MPRPAKTIFLTILSFLLCTAVSKAQGQSDNDSLVRLDYGKSVELLEIDGQNVRKVVGPAQFMHNNAYMLCDTALWNVDTQIIDAIGNVSLIQEGTVLTSDKMVYYVDSDLAEFRGSVVQLEDADHNMLRTSHLDYNTRDSVGVFDFGGSMRDKDGQIIESVRGTYDAKIKLFVFDEDVNMFTDSIFVRTTHLEYESERDFAKFGGGTDAWQDDNMLSADDGWYDRTRELFFFRKNVHVMTDTQEGWSDSLYFHRFTSDVEMLGRAQVTDTTRNTSSVAGKMAYCDSLSRLTLTRNPAIIARIDQGETPDSLYLGADTIVLYSLRMCDIDSISVVNAHKRLEELDVDPVGTYRRKAAEAAAAAAAAAAQSDPNYRPNTTSSGASPVGGKSAEGSLEASSDDVQSLSGVGLQDVSSGSSLQTGSAAALTTGSAGPPQIAPPSENPDLSDAGVLLAPHDSLGFRSDSLGLPGDSLTFRSDSLGLPGDSLTFRSDSLGLPGDSLTFRSDSLGLPGDSLTFRSDSLDIPGDSLTFRSDSLGLPGDSLTFRGDSLGIYRDSLGVSRDSLGFAVDSLGHRIQETPQGPLDTTKVGFAWAVGNIRMYREGMQVVCDSLEYTDLDSLARLYKDPIIWNEITQQYTADSITAVIHNRAFEKASLMSDAYVTIEEEPDKYYNQIKATEIIGYFDENGQLFRFDALGTATALFFLREDDVVATVNKTDSKMLYATFADGAIEKVYYFDAPKSDAYPVVQMPKSEQTFKGFTWQPERRPKDRYAVTKAVLRPIMRKKYESRPRAEFLRTEKYFPGYIPGIYVEIAQRDSLSKVRALQRQLDEQEREAIERQNTLDSLARVDSIAVADSIAMADSLTTVDSLKKVERKVIADSVTRADSVKAAVEAQRIPTKEEIKERQRAAKLAAREQRQAAKEARWDEKDRIDAEKAAAKQAKKDAKEREKKRKYMAKVDKKTAKEERRLEKLIWKLEDKDAASAAKESSSTKKSSSAKSAKKSSSAKSARKSSSAKSTKKSSSAKSVRKSSSAESTEKSGSAYKDNVWREAHPLVTESTRFAPPGSVSGAQMCCVSLL